MPEVALTLQQWLAATGIKPAGLAKLVPCACSTITRALDGSTRMRMKTARRVSVVTGNQVSVETIRNMAPAPNNAGPSGAPAQPAHISEGHHGTKARIKTEAAR